VSRSHARSRRFGGLGVLAVVFGLVLVPAVSASAETAGSNWWRGWYDVAGAQAAGWTGAGVKIAVIDGQINSSLPVFQGANLKIYPTSFCNSITPADTTTANGNSVHGSDVTALLVGNGTGTGAVAGIAPKAIVSFYADGNSDGTLGGCPDTQSDGLTYTPVSRAILKAVADGNRIIFLSQGATEFRDGDTHAVADAVAKGVVFVAAQPNTVAEAAQRFPPDANGVVGTNAFDDQGNLQSHDGKTTAYSSTTVVAAGAHFPSQASLAFVWGDNANSVTGSSLATPLVAGMLALTLQKYPSATGNQLIQSLILNTTAKDHALSFDTAGYGYGPASLSHLLRVDPTRYPDTNPLLSKPNGLGVPTAAEFAAAANGASPTPSASPSAAFAPAAPSPGKASGSILPGLLTGGIIVVVLLLVLAGLAVVLMRSLRRKAAPSTPAAVGPNSVGSVALEDETVPATTPQLLGPPT
jgi:hypothetical protein